MLTANTSTDSKNVFLVGDDSSTVNLYRSRLEQAGFRTTSASDAVGAFEALPNLSADLIILDLMLPKLDGFELLQAIRSDNRHRDTPVLVLSNIYLPEMAQKALRAGGNKALTKSECTSSELISVSRELVGIAATNGTGLPAAVGVSGTEDSPGRQSIEGPADADLAEQLKKALLEEGSTEVAAIRQHCLQYAQVVGSEESKEHLDKVYQSIRSLSARAGLGGCRRIAQLTGAIEAMLFDQVFRVKSGVSGSGLSGRAGMTGRPAEEAPPHVENPKFSTALKIAHYRLSPSSLQTLVQAVDCLGRLFTSGNTDSAEPSCKARVLQVDDDAICNMANEVAFKRVNYDTVSATDGSAALDLLNDNPFDLILLDINMPGMSGIELCQKLRCIPQHKHTPVIFVTLYDDFQNRAQSLLSGGDDVISKPISPFELIVKATVFLLSTSKPQVPEDQRRLKSSELPTAQSGTTVGGGPNPLPDQIWIASDSPSANHKPDGGSQSPGLFAEQPRLEGRTKKLHTVQATFDEKLNNLRQALAEETKRREVVEQQAAENVTRRSKLEAAIEENQRAQERFRQLLEESQQLAQASEPGGATGQLNLAGRRRALEQVRDFVADKQVLLKQALAAETLRREAVEQQAAENAKRRADLEIALGEVQQAQDAFQQELETADNLKPLLELEAALAESQQAREKVEAELESVRSELQAIRSSLAAKESEFEVRTRELQGSQAEVEQKIRTVTEALTAEISRRESAGQQADQFAARQSELEAELARHMQAQAQLHQELEDAQRQRQAHQESAGAEQFTLEARLQELQAAHGEAVQQVQRLKEELAAETERREAVKQRAAEHARCRGELEAALAENEQTEKTLQREMEASDHAKRRGEWEAELAENKHAQTQLRQELEEAQKQLRAQREQSSSAQDSNLAARAQELQAAQAEAEQQVQRLKEALTEETRRREGAEQQAGKVGQSHSELEAELTQLRQQLDEARNQQHAQQESSHVEQSRLEARARELQTAEAEVAQQVQRLKEELNEETRRRGEARQQAAEIGQRRSELEAELAQLRQQLDEARNQQQAQQESSRVEQSRLEARTQELQANRTTVEERIKSLVEALAAETRRREAAEQQVAQLAKRQSELEAELAENKRVQAKLQHDLAEAQKQLRVHAEGSRAEQVGLEARTKELQTAQVDLEQKVKQVTEALAGETKRREGAELQAAETGQRRSELEAELARLGQRLKEVQERLQEETQFRQELQQAEKQLVRFLQMAENKQAQEQVRQQLEEAQKQLQVQKENYLAEQSRLEARTKELQAAQAEAEQKAASLAEMLAAENRQRENTGQPSKRQSELETELAENKQAQAQLQQQLEEVQNQLQALQENYLAERSRLEARTKELQAAQAAAEEQLKLLSETLEFETKRRQAVERLAVDAFKRRRELEAELAKKQAAEKTLQGEMQASDGAKGRDGLETRLAENQQAQAKLRQQLEEVQKELQAQKENYLAEQSRLEAGAEALQSAQAEVQEKVRRVTEALAEETRRRESAEQQAAEIGQRRSRLEAELTQLEQRYNEAHQQLQAETQLRQVLQQAEKQLVSFLQLAEKQNYLVEQSRLEPRTLGLEAAEADAMQRVKRLTNALAEETRRREGAEQQAGKIGQRRSELEAQLAESQQTQARLHQELQESKKQLEVQRENCIAGQSKLEARTRELDAFTNDLAALRSRIEEESLQRGKLAEKIVEAERSKAELATQADAARDLVRTQENSLRSLDSQVQQRQWEVHRLESLLQAEIAQRQQEQSKAETLARQAAELTGQIEEKVAAQQRWHRRQSLLKQCIRRRKDQIAKAAAAARIQEAELNSLSSTIDEMRVVQSALCAQVRGLTTQHDSASRHVDELNAQSQAAARMIQARDQQLAALRHAILDAAHIGANISRERLRGERQSVEGWKRMMATLLHTPLSLAQRRLGAEIMSALEGWKQGRGDATKGVGFQVEPLDLNPSEFDCTEVIECALAAVRKNAEETGAKVQAALVGQVPEFVYGSARHIHQLITMLAISLPRIGRPKNLEVQVSFAAKQNGTAGMLLSLLLSPAHSHETLCRRLTTLTKASASLRAVRRRGSELTLSAAWQLALALGASSSIETTADQKVRVQISLPLSGTL